MAAKRFSVDVHGSSLECSANLGFLFGEVPFMERFARAAEAGFHAVEYMFPYDYEPGALRAELARHGLAQDLFNLPAGDFGAGERGLAVSSERREEFRRGVETALAYAAALGCEKLNCLVGLRSDATPFESQYACLVDNLAWATGRIGGEGASLLVELLNPRETPNYFLDRTSLVRRLLDDISDPAFKFQLDVYHLQRTEGDLIATIRTLGSEIGHVQIADAPDRHEPGTGEINYANVLAALRETGYTGRIGLEYRPTGRTEDSFAWIGELAHEALGHGDGTEAPLGAADASKEVPRRW